MNDIGSIIAAYRRKAHLSQIELAQRLQAEGIDVSSKTISAWEKHRNEPGARAFLHVCRILEVPDCIEEFFGSNPQDPLSALNGEGKQKVLSYIDMLLNPVSYRKESGIISPDTAGILSSRMRKMRLYDIRVSAGTGDFLDSDYYTLVDVDEKAAGDADFAVTISGDSMEPAFHDHDMVLVHRQEVLEDGEIGIFALNNSAYIKKLRNNSSGTYLISLNPEYAPIPVHPETDSFRIFGRVCRTAKE